MACGKKSSPENPVLLFMGTSLHDLRPTAFESLGWKRYCVECLLKMYQKEMEQLESELKKAREETRLVRSELESRKAADMVADALFKELKKKGSVSFTENIIIYTKGGSRYFLKVTDFEKGYWAQVPLDEAQLRTVLRFFEMVARNEEKRQGNRDITSFISQ
jgi:hypothetical protein